MTTIFKFESSYEIANWSKITYRYFKSWLENLTLPDKIHFCHSNTGLVCYLEPHCIAKVYNQCFKESNFFQISRQTTKMTRQIWLKINDGENRSTKKTRNNFHTKKNFRTNEILKKFKIFRPWLSEIPQRPDRPLPPAMKNRANLTTNTMTTTSSTTQTSTG